jgi:regulator of protease activity HflC (stomatin/prohibitin superfamily)
MVVNVESSANTRRGAVDPAMLVLLFPLSLVIIVAVGASLRRIHQWEVALRFTFGRYTLKLEPGLRVALPLMHGIRRVDLRVRNRDVPQQMVITLDNVTTSIDAVVYYRVTHPEKAIIEVEDYETAVLNCAQVVLRDVCGETMLDHLLAHRDEIAAKVRIAVDEIVAPWGIRVELIALQDIRLPVQMQEVIAKKAIAERDRLYVVIKSQADVESAKNFAEAARILGESPGAMELRRLEALQSLSHGSTKVIFDLARTDDSERRAIGTAVALAEDGAPKESTEPEHPELPFGAPRALTRGREEQENISLLGEALATSKDTE